MGSTPSKGWRRLRNGGKNKVDSIFGDSDELIGPHILPWLAKWTLEAPGDGMTIYRPVLCSSDDAASATVRRPPVLRGESWSKTAELHKKFENIPAIFSAAEALKDVDSRALTPALEELDLFGTVQPHHTSGLRQKWASTLLRLGWTNLWQNLWSLFWTKDFLKERLNRYPVRRLNFALAVRIMWNVTETSAKISEQVIDSGVMGQIMEQIDELNSSGSRAIERYFVSGFLSIICNCLRHSGLSGKDNFMKGGGHEIVAEMIHSKFTNLRLKALIALTYAASEGQPHVLLTIGGSLEELLKVLEKTLDSDDHRHNSFYSIDLLECLTKFAVIADTNKLMMVQKGGLSIFVRCMKEGNTEEEVSTAARGVWVLSLVDENRSQIRKEPDCMDILLRLKFHRNVAIADPAKGALWLVSLAHSKFLHTHNPLTVQARAKPDLDQLKPASAKFSKRKCSVDVGTSTMKGGHIMLSYSWDYKAIAHQVNEELRDAGHATWIDEDFMSGSILESMAQAIENASLVMVFLSESYKESPSCRTEAEYAFRLRKPILPIRNEEGFVADGWCGALVGNQLYFDCFSVTQVHETIPKILKEISQKMSGPPDSPSHSSENEIKSSDSTDNKKTDHHLKWTTSEVQDWLLNCSGFSPETSEKFSDLTGKNLEALRSMLLKAPEVYYSTLMDKYQLSLPEVLNLSCSLEEL